MSRATLGQVAAELAAPLVQVLDRRAVVAGVEVRREVRVLLQLGVRDRDAQLVTELLEVVERELLHLVGRVAALEALAEAVALDRLGEDDRRLALVLDGSLERGVHLAVVVTAATQAPHLVVGHALDELERLGIAAEEVLAHVGAVLGLVGLVVAVGRLVHQIDERAALVAREQVVPLAAPDDLDDVPAGTPEEALELLDDLAVAAHRSVETLQVAVDDEGQVVELLVGGPLQGAAALDLVHLAVAEERPDAAVRRIRDAAVGEVLVVLRLPDRVDRAETHRHGRELPELRHEARVRVRAQPAAGVRLLLAEPVELVLRESAFEVGAGVHAGGGVALVEDLVSARGVVATAEEPVVADLVQRRARRVGRDVSADGDAGALGAVHRDRGVPADPATVLALELLVTGERRLVLGRDRVDVVRRRHHRNSEVQILRPLEQAEHDVATAATALLLDEGVEGLLPFGGFLRVRVSVAHRIRVLVVDRHV